MSSVWSPRRILLAVVLLASGALLFVVASQYLATQRVAESVIQGEASRLSASVRSRFPFAANALEELLLEHQDEGLRYIRFEGHGGTLEAGESLVVARPERRGEMARGRGRVRITTPSPPPHLTPGAPAHPPPHLDRPPPRPEHRRPDHPPPPGHGGPGMERGPITLEFEPLAWVELRAAVQSQVLGGAFVLLALWVAFAFGWRALGRAALQSVTLAKQSRLAMLGEMSATLAHEIRNPLTSLKGHAQLLVESVQDEKNKGRAKRIVDEAIRLERLTADLLSFLRSGEISVSDNDPKELVEEVCESEPRVRLSCEGAPKSWPFDAHRLRQALSNLIENALQASKDEVLVVISAQNDVLTFEVADLGKGIDESVRERLFEPFVTSRTRGTGLGLAVALRVAESHGGTIEANGRQGGGTSFVLTVPRGGRRG